VTKPLCSTLNSKMKKIETEKKLCNIRSYKTKFLVAYSTDKIDSLANVIKYPLVTEKATQLLENNQYTFVVDPKCDKNTIKSAIEYLFNVKVIKINTCHFPKKKRRVGKYTGLKAHYKKAIVTLKEGNVINLFTEN